MKSDLKGNYTYTFKNFGELPAFNLNVQIGLTETKPTRQNVYDKPAFDQGVTVLFPNDFKNMDSVFSQKEVQEIIAKRGVVFIGILIRYTYGEKSGEYGVIIEHDLRNGVQDLVDEWAK